MTETAGATHVLIRGHVFTREEKAPFAPSGQSVLGAVEYDHANDLVKCHECGVWFSGLGNHIKTHGLNRREYNRRHGLSPKSSISSLGTRKKHSACAKRQGMSERLIAARLARSRERKKNGPRATELQNQVNRCAAQLLFRIQTLAARCGHTPGRNDLRAAGISASAIIVRFGSMDKAMRMAGLAPNETGHPRNPTPKDFPSKSEIDKRWEARMPWPDDYFGVHGLERKRA